MFQRGSFILQYLMIGPDWGEQLGVYPNGEGWRFTVNLVVVNYTQQEIITTWQPLIDWLEKRTEDYTFELNPIVVPGRSMWDADFMVANGLGILQKYHLFIVYYELSYDICHFVVENIFNNKFGYSRYQESI